MERRARAHLAGHVGRIGGRASRAWLVGIGLGAATVVATASLAFACSPRCCVGALLSTSGPADSTVQVRGTEFGGTTAEIRWASNDGALLATATGNDWTRTITVPRVAPGFYSIVVLGRDPVTNEVVDQTAPTFRVTGVVAEPAPTGDVASAPDANNPPAGTGPTNELASPEPAPATAQSAAQSASSSASAPSVAVAAADPVPVSPRNDSPATDRITAPISRTAGQARVTGPGSATPIPPAAGPAAAAIPAVPAVATAAPLGVVPNQVATPSSLDALPAPWRSTSALDGSARIDVSARQHGPLGLGLGFLALGSVGLFGAMIVLAVRRGRVKAL